VNSDVKDEVRRVEPVVDDPEEVLAALYRDRYAAMVRLAHLVSGSNAVAPDLVQDAFLKVRPKLPGIEHPAAYLRTAVVNECRSWLRRRELERRHAPDEPPPAELPPEIDEMWAALARLPERQRAALVLRYYEDLPLDEIAAALDCPLGTAKSLVHRGLASLKEVLR
jgi:RNA polymerase sigma-70 factor (sigma-E family)